MKKLILSFVFLAFFAVTTNAQPPKTVSLTAKIPYEAVANTQFEVEITINKPDCTNYAAFRQQLPEGFKAIEKESGTAIFNFENGFVTYKWLTLPRDEKIVLIYKVIPTGETGKTYKVAGTFKYISGNLPGDVSLETVDMKIMPKGSVAKFIKSGSVQQDTEVANNSTSTSNKISSLACSRALPALDKKKEFTVSLRIEKSDLSSTAKIVEKIPAGYTARQDKNAGSVFEFSNGQVVFLWNKLPKEDIINFSYKLIPADKKNIKEPAISGKISFIKSGKVTTQAINQQK